jgi:predicted NAD/FAD-binding protein
VLRGGSASYLEAMQRDWRVQCALGAACAGVRRDGRGVRGSARWRGALRPVVLACHADEALALLADPTPAEREVLGALRYQRNDTVLHTDARLLPRQRKAWAAWNAYMPPQPARMHGQLLHEPAAVAGRARAAGGHAQPHAGHRPGEDPRAHALRAPAAGPRQRRRAGAARRDQRRRAHLVRGAYWGLRFPRGRLAQRGRGRARAGGGW